MLEELVQDVPEASISNCSSSGPFASLEGPPANDGDVWLLKEALVGILGLTAQMADWELVVINLCDPVHEEVLPAEEGTMLRDAAFLVLTIVPMNWGLASNAVLPSLLYSRIFALGHLINNKY